MNKVKIEIKNRWTGSVLFEYEKENNTLKDTVIEAVRKGADLGGANLECANLRGANLECADLRGANLECADLGGADLGGANLECVNLGGANLRGVNLGGANLRGANLRGVNLGGAYIYVSDDQIDTVNAIKNFEERNNIRIKEWYINKYIIPTRWNCFWNYGLIVCDYEIKEEIVEEMTLEQICKELGRNIKIVKEN